MSNIIVMSRVAAKKYSYKFNDNTSVVVSITDVCEKENNIQCNSSNQIKAVLRLKFDDVDYGEKNCITEKDAMKIADFANQWFNKVDTIIVHCEAGISRSSGVAAAIMKYFCGDDMLIFNNRRYCPNRTCYRMVLNALRKGDYHASNE